MMERRKCEGRKDGKMFSHGLCLYGCQWIRHTGIYWWLYCWRKHQDERRILCSDSAKWMTFQTFSRTTINMQPKQPQSSSGWGGGISSTGQVSGRLSNNPPQPKVGKTVKTWENITRKDTKRQLMSVEDFRRSLTAKVFPQNIKHWFCLTPCASMCYISHTVLTVLI